MDLYVKYESRVVGHYACHFLTHICNITIAVQLVAFARYLLNVKL